MNKIVGISYKDREILSYIFEGDNINRFENYVLFSTELAKKVEVEFSKKDYIYTGARSLSLDINDFDTYFKIKVYPPKVTNGSIMKDKIDMLEKDNADLLLAIAKRDMIIDTLQTDTADILLELATKKGSA